MKKKYSAYCSACDANVLVTLEEGEQNLDPSQVECLDEGDDCAVEECPLAGATAAELAARLEFVPVPSSEESPHDLDEAEEMVEKARIASFRRQFRRRDG